MLGGALNELLRPPRLTREERLSIIQRDRVPAATLARWEAELTAGQYRAVHGLVAESRHHTYVMAATSAGVSVNSLKTQLRRVRLGHPDVWAEVMRFRARDLAARHEAALRNDEAHSRRWHRRQANRRYLYRFGHYPWE